MGRTEKMRKAWQEHKSEIRSNHPCSYQYLRSTGTVEQGNPVNQLINYAHEKETTYKRAYQDLNNVSASRRESSVSRLPNISNSDLDLVSKLIELDEETATGSLFKSRINTQLSILFNKARNTSGHKGINYLKDTCKEIGVVMANGKAPAGDITSVDEDTRKAILRAVNQDDKIEAEEDVEDEDKEEIDYTDEGEEEDEENILNVQSFWTTHGNFSVWAYASYINRDSISNEMMDRRAYSSIECMDEIQDAITESERYREVVQKLKSNQKINLPSRTIQQLQRSLDLVENGDAVRRKDILELLIEELSQFDSDNLMRMYEGENEDSITSPEDAVDEYTAREALDGTEYDDVDSLIEDASALDEFDDTGNIS